MLGQVGKHFKDIDSALSRIMKINQQQRHLGIQLQFLPYIEIKANIIHVLHS